MIMVEVKAAKQNYCDSIMEEYDNCLSRILHEIKRVIARDRKILEGGWSISFNYVSKSVANIV